MMLRLNIENVASLASGDPVEISLAEHGLVIGRAAHADWTLPDAANHVSSIHCEVDYRDGRYFLTDRSTNGTFINGAGERLPKPVQLRDGDLVQVGHYQIRVEEVPDATTAGRDPSGSAGAFGGGIDWGSGTDSAAQPASVAKFGREAARPMFQSSNDPMMNAFAPPAAAPRADPFGASFGNPPDDSFGGSLGSVASAATPAPDPFGARSSPASSLAPPADSFGTPAPASGDPFGMVPAQPSPPEPAPAPHTTAHDPFGATGQSAPELSVRGPFAPPPPATTAGNDPWAVLSGAGAVAFTAVQAPVVPVPPSPPPPPPSMQVDPTPVATLPLPAPVATAAPPSPLFARLLGASGLEPRDLGARTPETVVDTIGQLLRQTADGLFKLLEARTRVRHQFGVGAQVTTYQRTGNNPLKWTRSPEQALKQMIGDPGPGFLDGTQAVLGAFEDIQAHEMAMMAAMQEAMQETIRRFAPDTIRKRISAKGWLKSVLPGSREAILWRAYESEFSAFADESEAAYLDLFAKQFKKAYERIVTTPEPKG